MLKCSTSSPVDWKLSKIKKTNKFCKISLKNLTNGGILTNISSQKNAAALAEAAAKWGKEREKYETKNF